MSDDTIDNSSELRILYFALRRTQGFRLFLAECGNPDFRSELIAELEQRLKPDKKTIYYHHIGTVAESIDDLLPLELLEKRDKLTEAEKQGIVVFVSGLENSFPAPGEYQSGDFLQLINFARDLFPKKIPFPFVLWLSSHGFRKVRELAPDFWHWRSGTFYFTAPAPVVEEHAFQLLDELRGQNAWEFPSSVSNERIRLLHNLIDDLEALPDSKKKQAQKADILYQLGELHSRQTEFNSAKKCFQESLQIWEALGNERGKAKALLFWGGIESLIGSNDSAENHYKEALEIYRRLKDRYREANALISIGKLRLENSDITGGRSYFDGAFRILADLDNLEYEAALYLDISKLLIRNKGFETAYIYLNIAIQKFGRLKNQKSRADLNYTQGLYLSQKGDYKGAEEHYFYAFSDHLKIGVLNKVAEDLLALSESKVLEKQYESSILINQIAFEVFEKMGHLLGLMQVLGNQIIAFVRLNNISAVMAAVWQAHKIYEPWKLTLKSLDIVEKFRLNPEKILSKNKLDKLKGQKKENAEADRMKAIEAIEKTHGNNPLIVSIRKKLKEAKVFEKS